MSKHTPGPWKIDTRSTIKTPVNANAKHIAMVNFCKNGSERDMCGSEHDANARLIAAAPDSLTACELFVEAVEFNDSQRLRVAADAARAAVEKARAE